MQQRYLGPYLVILRNRGGAYILGEPDGTVFDRPIAAFCMKPFFARREPIAFTENDLDVDARRIRELEASTNKGDGIDDIEFVD